MTDRLPSWEPLLSISVYKREAIHYSFPLRPPPHSFPSPPKKRTGFYRTPLQFGSNNMYKRKEL